MFRPILGLIGGKNIFAVEAYIPLRAVSRHVGLVRKDLSHCVGTESPIERIGTGRVIDSRRARDRGKMAAKKKA